jgi:PAS domain S-box-containing protein
MDEMDSGLVNILLVEDNPDDVRLIREMLAGAGNREYHLECVDSVASVGASLVQRDVAAVLLDLSLPDSKGLETLRWAQDIAKGRPIVVLSGTEDAELAIQAVREGAQDYLVKGALTPQLLSRSLDYAIERNRVRGEISRFAMIVESSDDAIIGKTLDGTIVSWNRGAERMYGYSAPEAIGSSMSMLVPGGIAEDLDPIFEKLRRGERVEHYETVRVRKDGESIHVSLSIFPIFDPAGKPAGAATIARDITKNKRAEEALRRSEERFKLIEENIDEVFWIADPDISEITYISSAYERIWGRTRKSLLENPQSFIEGIYPDDRERVLSDLPLQREGKPFDHEYRVIHTDGSTRWIWDRGFPIRDDAGRLTHYAGVAQDITERTRLEGRFRQAQKMEAVGRLAGGVAHDFNNLLTIINGYSELVLDRLHPSDPIRGSIEEIRKAGGRAASLTRQLLAFSRQQVLAPQVLDLNALVAEVEKMLRRLIGEDIDLVMVPGAELGRVKADPGQIEQILVNLAVNARDAMPEGGKLVIETANVELDDAYARRHPVVNPGRYVMLAMSDTGTGMDAATQAHIFEPFFTTKEHGKGTGLGLSTVYGIVKQSGGFVWVYSEPGLGSTFKIYLPLIEDAAESVPGSEGRELPFGGSETILLVEDEEAVRTLASRILQERGYKVLESASPEDALQIAEQHQEPIALLLTDVVLPKMSGRKIAEHLTHLRPNMKVLYMSGYTDDAIVRNGVLYANTAFLQKPFAPAALARKVREVLDAAHDVGS